MPRWGIEALGAVSGGPRPLARTCPRLISSGVPPGRETGNHLLTKGSSRRENGVPNAFGCGSAALYYNPEKSSRAAKIHRGMDGPPLARPSIPLPQIPLPNSAVLPSGSVPRRQPSYACPPCPLRESRRRFPALLALFPRSGCTVAAELLPALIGPSTDFRGGACGGEQVRFDKARFRITCPDAPICSRV